MLAVVLHPMLRCCNRESAGNWLSSGKNISRRYVTTSFFPSRNPAEEAVTGKADITLAIRERQPVIIDFRGESEQVASVLLNGRKVPYTVKDEHIVIDTREVTNGENRVTIEFTANDQSLNRRDEFLYTLLVPDRARTLFPCFDQPDMKSLFHLSLEVPVFLAGCSPMGDRSRWI